MPSPSNTQSIDRNRRSLTWPSTKIHVAPSISRGMFTTYMSSPNLRSFPSAPSTSTSTRSSFEKAIRDPFEDELDEHPDAHFLSPVQMYEYEDWASDSDGDDEEVAWDAGITDFALFDSDRRRAEESRQVMPNHWENLLTSQAKAFQRAVERNNRADSSSSDPSSHPLLEDIPQLTPDHSPNLRDRMDMTDNTRRPSSQAAPQYLSSRMSFHPDDLSDDELDDSVSDLDDDDDEDEDDYDTPVAVLVARARERQRQSRRRLDRPGLRYSRTMSGKVHVWRRPGPHIYPVGEDVEAERHAEMLEEAAESEMS